jgi:translation initiation factor IF-3
VPEVRLVGPAGEQVGIVKLEVALRLAAEADLDLVEVAPDARPPVAKLMDYGKFKYESAQKARDARRNQANMVLKEIRFRLKIDPHDYGTKKGHVERFLGQGDKVKVMIMFRGREQSRPELGMRLLQRLADDVSDLGTVESVPRQDGRNMVMVLAPTKKKAARVSTRKRSRPSDQPVSVDDAVSPVPAALAAEDAAQPAETMAAEPAPKPVAPPRPAAPKPAAPSSPRPRPALARPAPGGPARPAPAATGPARPARPALGPAPGPGGGQAKTEPAPASGGPVPKPVPRPAPKPGASRGSKPDGEPRARTRRNGASARRAAAGGPAQSVEETTKES